jgi:vancomycin permeability regulator SanA
MRFQGDEMLIIKLMRKTIGILVLLAIVFPAFAIGKTWYVARQDTIAPSDVIVVLGTAQYDGVPSDALRARLVEAKLLFSSGYATAIITVGAGAPGDRTTEAASSKAWLVKHGIKSSDITAIPKGRDTFVSTQSYIAEMKRRDFRSVLIVTDPFHCLRATTIANDMGAKGICAQVRTGPNAWGRASLHYLVRETGAYLAYISLGRRGIHLSDHLGQA